jgi:lipopolysaccharide/colanic/teichoic acid biosynthesis glycosyltransferase
MGSVCAKVYRRVVKRLLDLLLSLVALPFVVLEFLIVAPIIYLEDRGSVFYNAPRVGKGGRSFVMYKYRSMRMGAPDLKMEDGSTYNSADDPRQTRIGAFLRKTSLDELPQVINVLKGDMSFIGPRPDLAEEVALYQGDEGRKLEVLPGISGYAQVYGRNALAWHDRLALDVYYVDHQDFLLDARIFFKTFAVVFTQEGVFVEDDPEPEQGAGPEQGAEPEQGAGPEPNAAPKQNSDPEQGSQDDVQ